MADAIRIIQEVSIFLYDTLNFLSYICNKHTGIGDTYFDRVWGEVAGSLEPIPTVVITFLFVRWMMKAETVDKTTEELAAEEKSNGDM